MGSYFIPSVAHNLCEHVRKLCAQHNPLPIGVVCAPYALLNSKELVKETK